MGRDLAPREAIANDVLRALRRGAGVALVALCVLAAVGTGSAAAIGSVTITSPADGSTTVETTPTFTGTKGALAELKLAIYPGSSASGTPVQEPTTSELGETWEIAPQALAPGIYTAVAYEHPELLGETIASEPVTFTIESAPVVTANPSDRSVQAGETASFSAGASGVPPPSVRWQVSTDSGGHWADDFSDGGAGTGTVTVKTTAAENGYMYRAVFTNAAGEAVSEPARLEVLSAPTVTKNPVKAAVHVGETAHFTASATGNPAPTVQWEVWDGSEWNLDLVDAGNTSETLSVLATLEQNGFQYRAVFENGIGSPARSSAALLQVSEQTAAPVVTANPSSTSVIEGEAAVFTASASGKPAPSVQWWVLPPGGSWSQDTSDTGNKTETLVVKETPTSKNGNQYAAVFSNGVGSPAKTAAATLTVSPKPQPPVVTKSPSNVTAVAGEAAHFTATASGVPTPEVQWEVSTDEGSTWTADTTDAGNNTGTLTVSPTTGAENGYRYRAVFSNGVGAPARTTSATLTVHTSPTVTVQPTSVSVMEGETAEFTAEASGKPTPSVQWQVKTPTSGKWESDTTDFGNKSTTMLVAAGSTLAKNGNQYRAVFSNGIGEPVHSAEATLTVALKPEAPSVTGQPQSTAVTAGQPATFSASAGGFPTPTVQWEVSIDKGAHWAADKTDLGNTSTTLTVPATTPPENGFEYRATFSNKLGSATTNAATLTVHTSPVVTLQPSSVSVLVGESAEFTAEAAGNPAPSVQWQVKTSAGGKWESDTTDFGNKSTTMLVAAGSTLAKNGYQYRALFSNGIGSPVPSNEATLTVALKPEAPSVTGQPQSVAVAAGQPASFTAAATGIPTPSVEWLVSTDGGSSWAPDTTDAGADTNTLTISSTTPAENGYEYRAVYSNTIAKKPMTSATVPATLTVETAPVVTVAPISQTVTAGQSAVFTAAASGNPTPSVAWQVSSDGGASWSDDTTDPGAGTTALTVPATTAAESGYQYRAVFTNVLGRAESSAATLTVITPAPAGPPSASFTWFPPSPRAGEAVSLVSTSGSPSPIVGLAWDVSGSGSFVGGGTVFATTFATAGAHRVSLRVTDAGGQSSVVTETVPVGARRYPLMQPFPVVRIAGSDNSFGARVSLLSVQAPVGARVGVICHGRGCPAKRETRLATSSSTKAGVGVVAFRRFERSLRAGIVLEIRVSKPGQIGKYTSFRIRRRRLPLRSDLCLGAVDNLPMPCPTS